MKYTPNNTEINIRASWALNCATLLISKCLKDDKVTQKDLIGIEDLAKEFLAIFQKVKEYEINKEAKKHEMREKSFNVEDHVENE